MKVPILAWFLIPTFILVGAGVWFLSKSQGTEGMKEGTEDARPVAVSKSVEGTVKSYNFDEIEIFNGAKLVKVNSRKLENYQKEDGSVVIPDVLHKYLSFKVIYQ